MRRSLKGKLILSYLAVAFITVMVVSIVLWLTSNQSYMSLVVDQQSAFLKESAQSYYAANQTMDGFFDYYTQSNRKEPAPPQPNQSKPPRSKDSMRGLQGLVDADYRALIPTFGYDIGQAVPSGMIKQAIPVDVEGKTIAWIIPDSGMQFNLSSEEQLYLQRTSLAIGLAALAGVLLAVGMGYFLAGRLLKPIRRLTSASRQLARGELQQQVPVSSQDELGLLTATFNQMSADLHQADLQRKRMTADISHDLSTPLQVISGYIEMLEEGEVPLTPQRIEIIKTEIGHLRRLVGDLSTLTQAEANGLDIQLQTIAPAQLLQQVFHTFQPIASRQGIELKLENLEQPALISVDEGRMLQVLKNLVENALRYTPQGGVIQLSMVVKDRVHLLVSDNGTGIESEDLPYVFERFFQADKARDSNSGKMGLGLAICKALVAAQGGTIAAKSAGKGLGTTMVISFAPAAAPDSSANRA